MTSELEQMPPCNLTHHHLWAMGFTKEERDRIIETFGQMWPNDPVRLGRFITLSSKEAIQCLNIDLPRVSWWTRFWNLVKQALRF